MPKMTQAKADEILGCPMDPDTNDAGACCVREYMTELMKSVWHDGEGFSGKRPFGTSGWEHEVYTALVRAKIIKGTVEDGEAWADGYDTKKAHALVAAAIDFI